MLQQRPLIRPFGPPSPLSGEGLLGVFYRLPPTGGKLSSEARLMRGLTVEGWGIFRPRARYFPWMESTQRSPGLRTRTRGARLENGLNLFGAGMNLGPLRPPPAAARAGQIRRSFFPNIAPLVCLAFSALFGRGRPMWRPVRRARRPGAPRRRKVRCAQDAQAWASLAALPCSSSPI